MSIAATTWASSPRFTVGLCKLRRTCGIHAAPTGLSCRLTPPIWHRGQHLSHAMDERLMPREEKARAEPEIIPPDRDDRQSRPGTARIRLFVAGDGTHRIYVARLGPPGIPLLALMIGILFAIMLVVVLGAFLIWIPLVGVLVAAAIVSGLLRGHFRRPR
jgi:hypothetical protein